MPTPMLSRRRHQLIAALALTAALVLPSCGAAVAAVPSAPSVPILQWADCGGGMQCAAATVPQDYAHPGDQQLSLHLVRLSASDQAHRIGSLFVNPGGPGASGADYVRVNATAVFSAAVRARFDIIGFDPRFVPASSPVASCTSDAEFSTISADFAAIPLTSAQQKLAFTATAHYNQLCAQNSSYLSFGSTANVARDLDLLRRAVGDATLNYVGYSYGTMIGQTYAALFPDKIRSLVLDGVVDAKQWSTGTAQESQTVPFTARMGSAVGTYQTFQQFTSLCDQAGPLACPFAAGGKARAKFDKLAKQLRKTPIELNRYQVLDYPALVSATLNDLYIPLDWSSFAARLQDAYTIAFPPKASSAVTAQKAASANKTVLDDSIKAILQKATPPRLEAPNTAAAATDNEFPLDGNTALFSSVTCSDSVNPQSETAWAKSATAQDRLAPYFGADWSWSGIGCSSWQLPRNGGYLGPYDKATSAPLLVIGNRYDPATPYASAQAVAARIPGARLLTIDGYGHTSGALPSSCATAATEAYLISGQLPAKGTVCHQDVVPFAS